MSNILTNNINPRSGNKITIGGVNDTVSIAGTITYEDVTSVDSVGIITARSGVEVTSGTVQVGGDPNDGTAAGTKMTTSGVIQSTRASGSGASAVFMGFLEGDTSANFRVNANGSGYLMGDVGIGTDNPDERLEVGDGTVSGALKVSGQSSSITSDGFTVDWESSSNSTRFFSEPSSGGSSEIRFFTTNSGTRGEKLRIDSSGRLLVGVTSTTQTARAIFEGNNSSNAGVIRLACANSSPADGEVIGSLVYAGDDHDNVADIYVARDGGTWTQGSSQPTRLVFSTTADGASSPTERMRIARNGNISLGKNTTSLTTTGASLNDADSTAAYFAVVNNTTSANARTMILNRQGSDGRLIEFRQANTTEGYIQVSGTTVSLVGAHLSRWSQLPKDSSVQAILRGTVLSNLDEMCEWEGEDNEQLNRMKISDVEGDPNVSGVLDVWAEDEDHPDDFNVAMTGDFIIRIAQGTTVQRGDLLMSAGDGTAKPQDDDIIRSKTIAKVTSTNVSCTYDDGSYCVPCVLMAC